MLVSLTVSSAAPEMPTIAECHNKRKVVHTKVAGAMDGRDEPAKCSLDLVFGFGVDAPSHGPKLSFIMNDGRDEFCLI